ncbi:MAG: dockerin type I repeat-containing protein [Candidatus Peribacteraceae bacterium]
MKQKHIHSRVSPITSIFLVVLATVGAFTVGVRTANEGSVVGSIMATSEVLPGDFDGNGVINENDIVVAIELAGNLRTPTPEELKADPNQDGMINAADALMLMQHIKYKTKSGNTR